MKNICTLLESTFVIQSSKSKFEFTGPKVKFLNLVLYTVNSEIIACIYYCDSSTADKNARFNKCDAPRKRKKNRCKFLYKRAFSFSYLYVVNPLASHMSCLHSTKIHLLCKSIVKTLHYFFRNGELLFSLYFRYNTQTFVCYKINN